MVMLYGSVREVTIIGLERKTLSNVSLLLKNPFFNRGVYRYTEFTRYFKDIELKKYQRRSGLNRTVLRRERESPRMNPWVFSLPIINGV